MLGQLGILLEMSIMFGVCTRLALLSQALPQLILPGKAQVGNEWTVFHFVRSIIDSTSIVVQSTTDDEHMLVRRVCR
jgi:hypothetical protein